MDFTALNSPAETRADATSIRSTFNSFKRSFVMVSFSLSENDIPRGLFSIPEGCIHYFNFFHIYIGLFLENSIIESFISNK